MAAGSDVSDSVIAKLGAGGNCLWTDHPGATGLGSNGPHLTVATSGNVFATAEFQGPLTLGGITIGVANTSSSFVALLAQDNGEPDWSLTINGGSGSGNFAATLTLATDGNNLVVAGGFNGMLSVAGNTVLAGNGGTEGFALKFAPDGELIWTVPFADAAGQIPRALAEDPSTGDFVIGGSLAAGAGSNGWLAKLDANGNAIWSESAVSSGNAQITGLAVDATGEIATTTVFQPDVTGGFVTTGANDSLISKLDPIGTALWVRQVAGPGDQDVQAVAFDPMGDVLVAGFSDGANNLTSGSPAGGDDIIAGKLAP